MNRKNKALLCGFLVLVLMVSVVACAVQQPTDPTTEPTQRPTVAPTTEPTTGSPTVPTTRPPITEPSGTEDTKPTGTEPTETDPTQPSGTEPTETDPTQPPATEPPTTKPTQPPVTEPPTTKPTQPPVTEPPATKPTQPPVTEPPATKPTQPPATEPPTTAPVQPEVNYVPTGVTVTAPGVLVKQNDKAIIDYSNTKDGYVMVCYTASTTKKLKAQVKGSTTTYTYNLTPGKWVAFPLSDQNGDYKITIYQNVEGTKYSSVLSQTVKNVTMTNEFAPFIRSNQFVNFDEAPNAKRKAWELTAGITDPLKKVEKVYNFVVKGMCYDYDLAASVQSGYVPDLDNVLQKMKGICFDYAALMAGMLRSQGVPTKLVVGYAGDVYHAWISVWSEDTGWIDGVIFFDGAEWHRMDPTFASGGGNGGAILDYIGNGSNYKDKYYY